MKAEPSAQLALLDLQGHDSTIAQLKHRRSSLPQIAQLTAADAELAEADRHRVQVATRVSDLEREQARVDGEVEQVRTRRTRDEDRMASGAVTNPKDLENLQHEVAALDRRISTLEDEELVVMESLEEAQNELDTVLARIGELRDGHDALASERDEQWAVIDAQLVEVTAEREATAAGVPTDLLAVYAKIAPSHGGVAAAKLVGHTCQGCRLDITGTDLRELQAADADEVLRCPECSRIIVRVPSGQ